jgi:hypothetical protein
VNKSALAVPQARDVVCCPLRAAALRADPHDRVLPAANRQRSKIRRFCGVLRSPSVVGSRSALPGLAIGRPFGDHIAAFRTGSLVAKKILAEKRAHSTLFLHQEKSFQDLLVSWDIRCHPAPQEPTWAPCASLAKRHGPPCFSSRKRRNRRNRNRPATRRKLGLFRNVADLRLATPNHADLLSGPPRGGGVDQISGLRNGQCRLIHRRSHGLTLSGISVFGGLWTRWGPVLRGHVSPVRSLRSARCQSVPVRVSRSRR